MAHTPRPPIVAVIGHIDHGKSSLLDYIRKSNVVAGEAGGITQHVSAYEAEHEHEGVVRNITFLDTPGHEAFKALRARGAAAADVAILVIAADEGVKPQTEEAYKAAEEAQTPVVIAFTKIDKNGADVERAKAAVLEHGIYLEGLGGSIPYAAVSSKTGDGIPELLDLVLLTADLAELSADPSQPATGFVLESSQDPRQGISATLIIKDGTLPVGSVVVAGSATAPVRFIEDFQGTRLTQAGPSQPVRVSGWNTLPPAGTPFVTAKNKKEAEKLASAPASTATERSTTPPDGKVEFPLVVKADVAGSLEAILAMLERITHDRATIRILGTGVGAVGESDVKSAVASGGSILAFNVPTDASARDLADRSGITISTFSIIYELEQYVREKLAERAPETTVEEVSGVAKVLKTFSSAGTKHVLGAKWVSGSLSLGDTVKIDRRGIALGTGKITNLQVARVDTKEIKIEGEFGLQVETKTEIAGGDTLTAVRYVTTK